jgi:hypothetical protein
MAKTIIKVQPKYFSRKVGKHDTGLLQSAATSTAHHVASKYNRKFCHCVAGKKKKKYIF